MRPQVVRATALVLSWIVTGTSAAAGVPPVRPRVAVRAVGTPWSAPFRFTPGPRTVAGSGLHAAMPALPALLLQGAPAPSCVTFFGPQKYVRQSGAKTEYTTTFVVPSWITSPRVLRVRNGEANGTFRVSSATIAVNGTEVAGPNDFSQTVPGFERAVTLAPKTTLKVILTSAPGSYLTIDFCGGDADTSAPLLAVTTPAEASAISETQPRIVISYSDPVGSGQAGASGVSTSTLKVLLDGVDRTSLFAKLIDQATADLPASLALTEGPHRIDTTIRDVAGNQASALSRFVVDTTDPALAVVEPAAGSVSPTGGPAIRVSYSDAGGLDLTTLRVLVNGTDRTGLFTTGAQEAVATATAAAFLSGVNDIVVTIEDRAGNTRTVASSFRVDTEPPSLTITQPVAGARAGSGDVEVMVQYHDDQALDLTTFAATVDGQPLAMSQGPEGAIGLARGLADGAHTVGASVKDHAGHPAPPTAVTFTVDSTLPVVRIIQPPHGFTLRENPIGVLVEYSDAAGIDLASVVISVNGTPRQADFVIGTDAAGARLELPQGANEIAATLKDTTGHAGSDVSRFTIDSVAPQGAVQAPAAGARVGSAMPAVVLTWSDAGTGVDPASAVVKVDGVLTPFLGDANGATGAPQAPLSDGAHTVAVKVSDRAGNPVDFSGSFVVDTVAPEASITEPVNGTVTSDATPSVAVSRTDDDDQLVVKLLLRPSGAPAEQDVTPRLAAGTLDTLADGTYTLRLLATDRAGNTREVESTFEVDTVAPTAEIRVPSVGAVLSTATPEFSVAFADAPHTELQGGSVVLIIDDTIVMPMTRTGGTAVGVSPVLAEGAHTARLTVTDAAGLVALVPQLSFAVDLTAPVVTVVAPTAGSLVGASPVGVELTFSEPVVTLLPGSVVVDGVDHSGAVVLGGTSASGVLPLGDGEHTMVVSVADAAGNPAPPVSVTFVVDTREPVVAFTSPAEGAVLGEAIALTGTVVDADPLVTVSCARAAGPAVAAAVTSGGFECPASLLVEGDNAVTVTATDRGGRMGSVTRTVALDTKAPVLTITEPETDSYHSESSITVSGTVSDAHLGGITVDGVAGTVTGDAASAHGATFSATVPLGATSPHTLTVTATDAPGHPTTVTRSVRIDRTPPVVTITSPTAGAVLGAASVEVAGTVTDASPVPLVSVNDVIVTVSGSTFSGTVPVPAGRIEAIAFDAAGNRGEASVDVVVDAAPPVITIDTPAAGLITRAPSVVVSGRVDDETAVTLTIGGAAVVVGSDRRFSHDAPLGSEGPVTIALTAKDAGGQQTDTTAPVVIVDRTPPTLQVVSPQQGDVVGALPLVVQGFVYDATEVTVAVDGTAATRTGNAWQLSLSDLAEGPRRSSLLATDAAGNTTLQHRDVVLDLNPPVVGIVSPVDGALTTAASVEVTGTVTPASASVTVNGHSAPVAGGSFSAGVSLAEGETTLVATARTLAGRESSTAPVRVTRDSTPPTLELQTPARISRAVGANATAIASDALSGVASVTLACSFADTTPAPCGTATLTSPPYTLALTVPDAARGGSTLVVTATATDRAGNSKTTQRAIVVSADGVVVGQVLDDSSGLPLPGATVRLSGGRTTETDDRGRYTLPTGDTSAVVEASKPGFTTVERALPVSTGTGSVPVDARLTPLAAVVDSDGTVSAGPVSVAVASGSYRLTRLTPQGLPALLPLGWSPLAAFDLRGGGGTATVAELGVAPVHLVRHTAASWTMEAAALTPQDGVVTAVLPTEGTYALVIPDASTPPIAIPTAGEPLEGVDMVTIPATATSASHVDPATLPPGSDAIARGALTVVSPQELPSGTVVQARVTETFTLASDEVASAEERTQDVVLTRAPKPTLAPDGEGTGTRLYAEIPIKPLREPGEVKSGKVHLDILAGRESVRGTLGGSEPVTLGAGGAQLTVAAGALPEDVPLSLEIPAARSDFLPSSPSVQPLDELVLDFSSQVLGVAASLSVSAAGVAPDGTYVIARVERVDGRPYLTVVSRAAMVGERLVSQPSPGLPGVTREGRHVFYRLAGPIGLVAGATLSSAGPVKALVQSSSLPFVAVSSAEGAFVLAVAPGAVTVTARVMGTPLSGTAETTGLADETVALNVTLEGAVTTATVTPPNGALAVPRSSQVEITTTVAIRADSVPAATIRLQKDGATVAMRLVLSGTGKTLSVVPLAQLVETTVYTFEASGLKDMFGQLIVVPAVTFTTAADQAPPTDPDAIVFSIPVDGITQVTVAPGGLPSGTRILIINSGNADVATFTVGNDGSLAGEMRASINDTLLVTLTFPDGTTATFTKSQFEGPDGTTAVGPGGGVVKGAGGVELRIPEGAVEQGVTLKIAGFGEEKLAELFPNNQHEILLGDSGHFGSGMTIEAAQEAPFRREVDLVFPLPDFTKVAADKRPAKPEDASYYVYRRVQRPDGKIVFEVLDHAFVQETDGQKQIVTASPPFAGLILAAYTMQLMVAWTFLAALVGRPAEGAIVGKVRRHRWVANNPGGPAPTPTACGMDYECVAGAEVSAVDASGVPLATEDGGSFAISQGDGTYALVDRRYQGGPVKVIATAAGVQHEATAFQVDDTGYPSMSRYDPSATANITYPAVAQPPPVAPVQIRLMRAGPPRVEITNGIAASDTPLILEVTAGTATVTGVSIGDSTCFFQVTGVGRAEVNLQTDPGCSGASAGAYRVTATAVPPFGSVLHGSMNFLVVAAGGGNTTAQPGPPRVIAVSPRANATGISTDSIVQVTFSEPVRVRSFASLREPAGPVTVKLYGPTIDGSIADLIATPDVPVTGLTVQPTQGLRFSQSHTLVLESGVVDLGGAPLERFESAFTTFGPEAIPQQDPQTFGSPGIVVLQDRAYLAENKFYSGVLRAFNTEDPVAPEQLVSAQRLFGGRPIDIVGAENNEVTASRMVVVATSASSRAMPGNLHIFDTSDDAVTRWVGAVSVTNSMVEGFINRVALKGNYAYTATAKVGLQVVDLMQATQSFVPCCSVDHWSMVRSFATDGEGFGREAVVKTIPVPKPGITPRKEAYLIDVDVDDYTVDGTSQTMVFATGDVPYVVANPQSGAVSTSPVQAAAGALITGAAMALGTVGERRLAVIVGTGTLGNSLAVLDVTIDPRTPQTLAIIGLESEQCLRSVVHDVVIMDDRALIGATTCVGIVNLADPTAPVVAGSIQGVGGRLALSANGLLLSTARSVFGGNEPLGGVRVALLGAASLITTVRENPVLLAENRRSVEPQRIEYRVLPPPDAPQAGELEILRGGAVVQTLPAAIGVDGKGYVSVPAGLEHPRDQRLQARLIAYPADRESLPAFPRALSGEAFQVMPDEPLSVSADEDPLDVGGVNQAVLARLSRPDPPYSAPTLSWSIVGSGGQATPAAEAPDTGLYVTGFKTGTTAGTQQQLLLRMDGAALGGTMGRTAIVTVTPGRAATAGVRAVAPSQAPGQDGSIPADAKTEVELVVDEIRDAYGNLVADGTLVSWSAGGDAGTILEAQTATTAGRATSRYRAGGEPGQVVIKAAIDEKEWIAFIDQKPLAIEFTREPTDAPNENFRAAITWGDRFPVADDAPVEWTSTYGVTASTPVRSGVTTARWSPTVSHPNRRVPTSTITVALARSRGGSAFAIRHDGIRLTLASPILAADARPLSPSLQATASTSRDLDEAPNSGQTALRVEGGSPGAVVRLTLGSTLSPVVQAVAEWPLDAVEEEETADGYGGNPGRVEAGVTIDAETATQGNSLHFAGSGGLEMAGESGPLAATADLGLAGWVRFDRLTAGQRVVDKAGSYALAVVEQAGEFRLEFFATSGGVQRRALSTQALAAATWYHFSAQAKDGRLRLAVGSTAPVAYSEPMSALDPSPSPLVFGATLEGNLDQLQFFDLARPALAVFPGNATEIELTLDGEGTAETMVTATGVWQEPATVPTNLSSSAARNLAADSAASTGPSGQSIPIQYHVALDPPEVETYGHYLGLHSVASLGACAEGIGTGENDEWSGIGCDIALSFAIPLEIPLALRDLTVTLKNVVKGKASVASYVTGAFAVLSIIPKRLPVVGPVLRRISRAAGAINVPWVKKKLADKALNAAVEAATTGVVRTADEDLVKIAAGEAGEDARLALSDVVNDLDAVEGPAAWDAVEDLGRACRAAPLRAVTQSAAAAAVPANCYPPISFLSSMRRIRQVHGSAVMTDVFEIIRKGRHWPTPLPAGLSDEALQGLAVFVRHTRNSPSRIRPLGRVGNIWKDIREVVPPMTAAQQRDVFENMFKWINQGEAVLGQTVGWNRFLTGGPGTLRGVSTAGAYHVLDVLANRLGWQGIRGVEVAIGVRRMDIVLNSGKKLELKNLSSGAPFGFGYQVTRDIREARRLALLAVATTPGLTLKDALIAELGKLEYVFRGTGAQMANAGAGLRVHIGKALGPTFKNLAVHVDITALGRTLPY